MNILTCVIGNSSNVVHSHREREGGRYFMEITTLREEKGEVLRGAWLGFQPAFKLKLIDS